MQDLYGGLGFEPKDKNEYEDIDIQKHHQLDQSDSSRDNSIIVADDTMRDPNYVNDAIMGIKPVANQLGPDEMHLENPYGYYPQGVPPEVLEEVERARIEKKNRKEKLVLNCVPGLKGKTNRQKFIIKVYIILLIQLTFTFTWVGVTSRVDSKIA